MCSKCVRGYALRRCKNKPLSMLLYIIAQDRASPSVVMAVRGTWSLADFVTGVVAVPQWPTGACLERCSAIHLAALPEHGTDFVITVSSTPKLETIGHIRRWSVTAFAGPSVVCSLSPTFVDFCQAIQARSQNAEYHSRVSR